MSGGNSIRIRILGSAAGGGLPQWNCSCPNCVATRTGKLSPQTQSSVAVSSDGKTWFLINASPDLAQQIEATPELHPQGDSPRNTPIAGVLLTNADIDNALGMLLLRNHTQRLVIYATQETRSTLGWIDTALARFPGIEWRILGLDRLNRSSSEAAVPLGDQLSCQPIQLGNGAAFQLRDSSGATAVIAPSVCELTEELCSAIDSANLVLFDGTFWSDDELQKLQPGARTAREMHHWPINAGSLEFLSKSPARRKIYIHINNTNPILMPGSKENTAVANAGIEIARDGMEIVL